MKRLLTTTAILTCLIATQSAQAQNFNVINGNGNRVVNGGGGGGGFFGQSTARNHNEINGSGNSVINGGGFGHPAATPVFGGHPGTCGPAMHPQYQTNQYQTVQYATVQHQMVPQQTVQYQTVQHYQPAVPTMQYPQTYAHRQQPMQPRYRPQRATNPLGIPINVNYNRVSGNDNTVVNGGSTRPKDVAFDVLGQLASGSAQRNGLNINVNKVSGNRNTVINR